MLGLYPFQEPVHSELAHRPTRKAIEAVVLDGAEIDAVLAEDSRVNADVLMSTRAKWESSTKAEMKRASLETRRFRPDATQAIGAVGLFLLGIFLTRLLGRHGS